MATIFGTNSNNVLNGTANTDFIYARGGNDQLFGLGENDVLNGGLGNDRVDGGIGRDFADYSNSTINGQVIIGATAGVTVNLNLQGVAQNTGGAGIDTLVSIEDLIGTNFNDTLIGNAATNQFISLGGNDTLIGGAGDDDLNGGLGNDRLDGGTGSDTAAYLDDEAGGIGATAGVTVNLNLQGVAQNTGGAGIDTLVRIENLVGSRFNDTLTGNAADNELSGKIGNDTLNGGAGNDYLEGDIGNDRLDGGTGVDTMDGGPGNDTYIVDNVNDVASDVADTQGGIDLVQASVTYTIGSGVDHLTLTGASAIDGTGNALNNILTGNSANNVLSGRNGNDTLTGGAGTDTLNGDEGTDLLVGGLGADILNGGLGNDTFDYNALSDSPAGTTGWDVIELFRGNFHAEGDRIDLRDIDANSVQSGNQAFSYIGFDSFTAPGQLRYASGILSGNTDADASAEFQIVLLGAPVLTVNNVVSDILL